MGDHRDKHAPIDTNLPESSLRSLSTHGLATYAESYFPTSII